MCKKCIPLEKCLATTHPELCKEWHPEKNGSLTPRDVSYGMHTKVWWVCNKCEYEWPAVIYSRPKNHCPACSGRVVTNKNKLTILFPEICSEWCSTKNNDLLPENFSYGSNKEVWWLCKVCNRTWKDSICHRTIENRGCRYCAGKEATEENCLANSFPELINEWHPVKNGNLTPKDFTKCSGRKVWWICREKNCEHSWEMEISYRTGYHKSGCPACVGKVATENNCIATLFPEVAKEWHPTKNKNLTPHDVTRCSLKKAWWICSNCNNEWQTEIAYRTKSGIGRCPNCYTSNVSKMEIAWLKSLNNNNLIFSHRIERNDNNSFYITDGFDPVTNTIYEFNGGLFHGDPRIYKPEDINPISHNSFGELYRMTMERENNLRQMGYNIVVMWEKDWLELQRKK